MMQSATWPAGFQDRPGDLFPMNDKTAAKLSWPADREIIDTIGECTMLDFLDMPIIHSRHCQCTPDLTNGCRYALPFQGRPGEEQDLRAYCRRGPQGASARPQRRLPGHHNVQRPHVPSVVRIPRVEEDVAAVVSKRMSCGDD